MYLKIIYFSLLIILLVAFPFLPQKMDVESMVFLLSIAGIGLLFFVLRNEVYANLKNNFFKHSVFVLLGIVIVHFQFPLDYVLGLKSEINPFIWIKNSVVVKSLFFSTIGLVSFLLGFVIYRKEQTKKLKRNIQVKAYSIIILQWLAIISLVGYFLTVNKLYLVGYYGSVSMGQAATYLILLFKVVIFAIIIQNCLNAITEQNIPSSFLAYVKQQGYFLLALIVIYLFSVILSGDRGPIITFGLAYLAGYYFITKKKLSFRNAIIFLLIGAFFINTLGIARRLDKNLSFLDRIEEGANFSAYHENSIIPQTAELAGSVRTLHAVVSYVPEKHPHTWGRFQLQQILVGVPFSSNIIKLFFNDQYRYEGSSSFATWIIQGDNRSSGAGTTCIADLYVDFGMIGVIVGMFILGYFMRFSEVSIYGANFPALFPFIFSFVYLSDAVYISRSSFLFGFRAVVWIYVILLVNRHIFNRQ